MAPSWVKEHENIIEPQEKESRANITEFEDFCFGAMDWEVRRSEVT